MAQMLPLLAYFIVVLTLCGAWLGKTTYELVTSKIAVDLRSALNFVCICWMLACIHQLEQSSDHILAHSCIVVAV